MGSDSTVEEMGLGLVAQPNQTQTRRGIGTPRPYHPKLGNGCQIMVEMDTGGVEPLEAYLGD